MSQLASYEGASLVETSFELQLNDADLEAFYAWEKQDRAKKAYQEEQYFAWLNRCRDTEAASQAKWEKNPGIYDPQLLRNTPSWDTPSLSDDERQQRYLVHDLEKFKAMHGDFSTAGHLVTTSHDRAAFFDDIKCRYLGDSERLGRFREVSPAFNDSGFDVQFDYNVGVLNSYTDTGTIIHMRETQDPEAKTREQKLFILAINLASQEVTRLYADNNSVIVPQNAGFDEVIPLKHRPLSARSGQAGIDADNPFAVYYQHLQDKHVQQQQPKLVKSARGFWAYQAEQQPEFSTLHEIRTLDLERQLLGRVAVAAEYAVDERGAIELPYSQQRIA